MHGCVKGHEHGRGTCRRSKRENACRSREGRGQQTAEPTLESKNRDGDCDGRRDQGNNVGGGGPVGEGGEFAESGVDLGIDRV